MRVERRCHVCQTPIRGDVAYARRVEAEGTSKRIYAHPTCFFEEVPDAERETYRREVFSETKRTQATPTRRQENARVRAGEDRDEPLARGGRAGDRVIEVDGLEKTYPDGTRAVKGVRFSVQRGEIFGILGPNGAGKTTLIGMLGTLVKPTGGQATVAGIDVTEDPDALKSKLGFAMQEVGVDGLARGREFLKLQARLYGIAKAEAADRAQRLLELFDLTDAADKRIESYSGGMKRRIDLAGALIHEPVVIFLDEPTEGLDPRGRREMWELVERLNRELDATILLSTHYMEEADALCDRLAIMDEGGIVVEGTPEELKATVGEQSIVLSWDRGDPGGRLDAAEALILGDGLAETVQRSGGELHAYVSDPARAIAPLLRGLDHEGLAPESLTVKGATLDDVYLAYTGRSIEQAERAEETDQGVPA